MDLKHLSYTGLVAAVGLGRLLELRVSRRHQHRLERGGMVKVRERHFRAMVGLHVGVLGGSVLEVWLLKRRCRRWLAFPALVTFFGANVLRWWVIRTLADHWNVEVMDSLPRGVIAHGPYRFIRHPNYVAVFLELLALPLIAGAWLTAVIGSIAHLWVLKQRIATEESVLLAHSAYREAMGHKPRFMPRWRHG
ncbi:MAG: hypothetical protein M3R24_06255 [Chloroflexota bacterium]|nr:hypothetical protein [Chloroflexota bacterium]